MDEAALSLCAQSLRLLDGVTKDGRRTNTPRETQERKTVIDIDSTGAKVYSEGEGKVRQHGPNKRRTKIQKPKSRRSLPTEPTTTDWLHGNQKDIARHARNENENTILRYKTIFGDKVASRRSENQTTELRLGCRILNIMFYLGMPKSVPVVA